MDCSTPFVLFIRPIQGNGKRKTSLSRGMQRITDIRKRAAGMELYITEMVLGESDPTPRWCPDLPVLYEIDACLAYCGSSAVAKKIMDLEENGMSPRPMRDPEAIKQKE